MSKYLVGSMMYLLGILMDYANIRKMKELVDLIAYMVSQAK